MTQLFDLMEMFGRYGFNKAHSAAYALIAFQTAWLKAHYPVEFMASLLTSEMGSIESVVKFIDECRSHKIEVLPPDVNESFTVFTVVDGKIRFGLVAVKNVGEGAIDAIVEARAAGGKFSSLFEFCERADLRKINKRVMESLIRCGAFDSTGAHRAQMMAALEDALEYGQRVQKEKASPQMGLFDMGGDNAPVVNAPALPDVPEWDDRQVLTLEKEALGFYISGHPLGRYEKILKKFANTDALALQERNNGEVVRIGGLITAIKKIKTRKGDDMAFITTEDLLGSVETTIFSSVYETTADLLVEDAPILIEGQVQKDEKSVKLLADKIIPMEKAEETCAASVHFKLDAARTDRDLLVKLREICGRHPGNCPGFIHLKNPDATETVIAISEAIRLKAGEALSDAVNGLLGYEAVDLGCKAASISVMKPKRGNGYGGRP
ncbi:hypothetical protein DENIS_0455 [Desulfonema ishimotonii]|uniref:Uncharacterized protein n=1 Tax=Desulfonema ishimotonii TaxID=45657 RepID=A0A401FRC4_9BACT|nr:OB-fold nucleic acid binding domain-containing protein [Desulfonema ishimotonii]GBC59516.1 hypothetical protein DENIS_0455 [Desulfonema ishimotonii]